MISNVSYARPIYLRIGEKQRKSLLLNLGRFLETSGNDTLHEVLMATKRISLDTGEKKIIGQFTG